jgi:hypothetical protein
MRLYQLTAWLQPSRGRGVRDLVALTCVVQAWTRILGGTMLQPVNILPSALYGWLMLAAGIGLLTTGAWCQRGGYLARGAALYASALWFLLATDVWGAGASFGTALLFALAIGNEVRYRGC